MTYQTLFESALALICEDKNDRDGISDYIERAPYLFANVLTACEVLDQEYREFFALEQRSAFDGAQVSMEASFELAQTFAPAAVYYVASMLVLDENEKMSDRLFDLYSGALSNIQTLLEDLKKKKKEEEEAEKEAEKEAEEDKDEEDEAPTPEPEPIMGTVEKITDKHRWY